MLVWSRGEGSAGMANTAIGRMIDVSLAAGRATAVKVLQRATLSCHIAMVHRLRHSKAHVEWCQSCGPCRRGTGSGPTRCWSPGSSHCGHLRDSVGPVVIGLLRVTDSPTHRHMHMHRRQLCSSGVALGQSHATRPPTGSVNDHTFTMLASRKAASIAQATHHRSAGLAE